MSWLLFVVNVRFLKAVPLKKHIIANYALMKDQYFALHYIISIFLNARGVQG